MKQRVIIVVGTSQVVEVGVGWEVSLVAGIKSHDAATVKRVRGWRGGRRRCTRVVVLSTAGLYAVRP